MKKLLFILFAIIIAVILLISIVYFSSSSNILLSERDGLFIKKINGHFRASGSPIKLSIIHEDEWNYVCTVSPYEKVSAVAEWAVNENEVEIEIASGVDEMATDDIWGFVFIDKNGRAEYLKVSSSLFLYGGDSECLNREEAALARTNAATSEKIRIRLIKISN